MNFFFEETEKDKPIDELKLKTKKESKEEHSKHKESIHEEEREDDYFGIPEHWKKATHPDDKESSLF